MSNAEGGGHDVRPCPSLKRLTPIKGFTCSVQYGDRTEPNVNIQGIWPTWHGHRGPEDPRRSPLPSPSTTMNATRSASSTRRPSRNWGLSTNPVGEKRADQRQQVPDRRRRGRPRPSAPMFRRRRVAHRGLPALWHRRHDAPGMDGRACTSPARPTTPRNSTRRGPRSPTTCAKRPQAPARRPQHLRR